MNRYQKTVTNVPVTRPATAPALVAPFQYSALVYMGRKAAAHNPKNIAVPRAIMLPGRMYPRTTAIITATVMPALVIMMELLPFCPVSVSYMSLPIAVP
ncbi:Uncharacterised protein [uncultured archaeon]|nr:Uncharacterised protein [uncultured archaeon]